MGMILSRFRKKKTTIEVLEDLDTKIKEIEQYGQTTEQTHKKIVGRLIVSSVILYIVTAFVFYFYFFPASLYDQIFYIIPLLIFPILILLTKKMVSWYYKRKISRNRDKLTTMQSEKKKILEEVTETETYKKAKEILMKFAPDQLSPLTSQKAPAAESPRSPNTPRMPMPLPGSAELRRRIVTSQIPNINIQSATPATPNAQSTVHAQSGVKTINSPMGGYRTPLPRPILPRQRTYLDRLVDYVVGDGPSNRYALICRNCESHNGMALKEEFEYFSYRCGYCNFWNPARKQKPSAPKLEYDIGHQTAMNVAQSAPLTANTEPVNLANVETPSASDTDSDIEVVERPNDVPSEDQCDSASPKDEDHKSEANETLESEGNVERMDVDESLS